MAKTGTPNTTKTYEYTKTLKCVLSQEELLKTGTELARALDEQVELEEELQSIKDSFKGKLTTAGARITSLKSIVRDKCDYRKVDCEQVFDNKTGTVTETRKDTGEVIETRKMTADERQSKMFDE